jgi:CRAL/TRIO domain
VYVNEYLWQIVESKNALATMTGIIDMQGLNLAVIRKKDIMNFLKEFVRTMDSHYPQRAHKTLILNAPKWFNILYKIVSPLLRESTKSRIEIHARGKRQDKVLYGFLGKDAEKILPQSFFSKKKKGRAKPRNDDAEDGDDDELPPAQETPIVSQLESDLRAFVSGSVSILPPIANRDLTRLSPRISADNIAPQRRWSKNATSCASIEYRCYRFRRP